MKPAAPPIDPAARDALPGRVAIHPALWVACAALEYALIAAAVAALVVTL